MLVEGLYSNPIPLLQFTDKSNSNINFPPVAACVLFILLLHEGSSALNLSSSDHYLSRLQIHLRICKYFLQHAALLTDDCSQLLYS